MEKTDPVDAVSKFQRISDTFWLVVATASCLSAMEIKWDDDSQWQTFFQGVETMNLVRSEK